MYVDTDLMKSYFKVLEKIWINTLAGGFWVAVIIHFVFKVSFQAIITIALTIIFAMLTLTILSFTAVFIAAIISESSLVPTPIIVGGFVSLIGIFLARLSCNLLVGSGENATPAAGVLTQIAIALGALTVTVVLILLVASAKSARKSKLNKLFPEFKKIKMKQRIFLLNELIVLIVAAFAVTVSIPIAWITGQSTLIRYAVYSAIGVAVLLVIVSLVKSISVKLEIVRTNNAYRKLTEHILEYVGKKSKEPEVPLTDILESCCWNFDERFVDKYNHLIPHILYCAVSEKVFAMKTHKDEQYFSVDISVIDEEFKRKTKITNKTDLIILAFATALHTIKAIIVPKIMNKELGYGESFDPKKRSTAAASDKKIKQQYKNIAPEEVISRLVPYDTIAGSAEIGKGMSGKDHRLHTLGHDPILGWIFGVANILTDTITFDDFSTYRINREIVPRISTENVMLPTMFAEAIMAIKNDKLCLPAAIFAQAIHLKSDVDTKMGLPVPLIQEFSPKLAGKLYSEHYDALCFAKDMNLVVGSAAISRLFNLIISSVHGLYYNGDFDDDNARDLYEVRTRKIIDISNSIASASSIINAALTKDVKNLDIGGILVTIFRLFSDIKFINKIKREYVQNEKIKFLDDGQKKIMAALTAS